MKNFIIILSLIMAQPLLACPTDRLTAKCPKTEVTNYSKTWTEDDQQALKDGQKHCAEEYPGVPCLTNFVKFIDGSYQTTCGRK